jgi:hypothetical protein
MTHHRFAFVGLILGLTAIGEGVAAGDVVTTRRALIVCGLPGDDEHRTLLAGAVSKIIGALTTRCGFGVEDIWLRFGDEAGSEERFGPVAHRGPARRNEIERDVAELRRRLGPEDALWVIVLGHGHYDGHNAHVNLPGPDIDGQGLGKLFAGIPAREQVFFLTTSASGYLLRSLSVPGRVVITATEPDREVNETLFPLALTDVLAAPPPEADRDKDGVLSLLELYVAVVAEVLQRYATAEEIPTEHARLDDNGDGRGSEVQQKYLPLELRDPVGKNLKENAKVEETEVKLGPKDDGVLAATILVERLDKPGATGGVGDTKSRDLP